MTRAQRIIVAASVVAGAFGLYEVATSFLAYTADAYVRSDLVAVAPRVSGQIIAVNVEDNQTVAQGDLLVMIDPVPFQVVADQHRAELEEARAQVAADQDAVTASEATLTAAVAARGFATGETAWVWLDSEPWHLHKARVTGIARGINREPSAGHCHVNLAQAA
jgi:membrane fusion protein, multidrug efflux system